MYFFKARAWLMAMLLPLLSLGQQPQTITGTVTNNNGEPVVNATISAKHSQTKTGTNAEGVFSIAVKTFPDTLWITHVGYGAVQYPLKEQTQGSIVITLSEAANHLDETVVIGYGKTTKRLNTGSVAKVAGRDIAMQPVLNPLNALGGRMAGVTVTSTSGIPGSQVNILVRGRGSILQGSEPLFIIDGVPMAAGNQAINKLGSVMTGTPGTGLSPMSGISPQEIESIEVLKDADATAIYGSRGANGVVLITTKKGRAGKSRLVVDVNRSISRPTRTVRMLDTKAYLQLRREAFANDGVAMTTTNAPDMLVWDTTRYTDLGRLMSGEYANALQANVTLSGGDKLTQYSISGGYRKENTVFSKDMGIERINTSVQLGHTGADGKLRMNAGVYYGYMKNTLTADKAGIVTLPPNVPAFYDSTGKLNWQEGGTPFMNPMAYRHNTYDAQNASLNGRVNIQYRILKGLFISASAGYHSLRSEETAIRPLSGQDPAWMSTGSLDLGTNHFQSWIAEPQLNYAFNAFGGRLELLAGSTWQRNLNTGSQVGATGYTSDNLIRSLAAAPTISIKSNNERHYKYHAVFGRVNYNYRNKYLLNISGRNDGSSRFGAGKRFSTFGAVGAGWIFSEEGFIKRHARWFSFGKLRSSYGTSGNDQIGDYGYVAAWTPGQPYQGGAALYPTNLANSNYRWETNRKLEAAIELGFLEDRLWLSVAWYRNRSGNQLVNYLLPSQTGFTGVIQNLDAVVENTGFEFTLNTRNIENKHVAWSTSFNLTIPKNRLVRFPGLAGSSYANRYVIGEPLGVVYRYKYLGVDEQTGVMKFDDTNKDGVLSTADYVVNGHTDAVFYGGMQNSIRVKQWRLDVFVEFKKQDATNYLHSLYSAYAVPGMMYNMPELILQRWMKPGDVSEVQRLTAVTTSSAYKAGTGQFMNSSGIYSDASFVRLKNVQLQYELPTRLAGKAGMQQAVLYLQGHNLATLTRFKGTDPEVPNLYILPPLKTFTAGITITF